MGFEVGDLVWAKMKGFPPWPAKVVKPTTTAKPPKNKKVNSFVLFFGTHDHAWIPEENITHHTESILDTLSKKRSKSYQQAIDELLSYQGTKKVTKQASPKIKDDIKNEDQVETGKKTRIVKIVQTVSKKPERKVLTHKSVIKKVPKKIHGHNKDSTDSSPKSSKLHTFDPLANGESSKNYQSHELPGCSRDTGGQYLSSNEELGILDLVDLDKDSETNDYKKFGFIGLDEFGKAILAKFIEHRLDVMLWSGDIEESSELKKMNKAKLADSPAQLIVECDATFCCYETDTDAFKNIIFGERGILEGFEEAEKLKQKYKGFVLFRGIDCEISKEINEAITVKNGYYLEAPILGTSEAVVDKDLIVLASGNRKLFTFCKKCFQAIATRSLFVSCEIGSSLKMSVLLNTVSGTLFAALNEVMVLSERLNVYKGDFHQVLRKMLQGDTIGKKLEKMSQQNYEAVTPLKHVQKDMNLALNLADGVSQSMPISSTANEVFKHARLMKYGDSDVSAIYKVVKLF